MIDWSLFFTIVGCGTSYFMTQFIFHLGEQKRWACVILYLFCFASTLESFLRNFLIYVNK